ncbi:hypothetical protein ACQ3HE_06750 [Plantibacter auratus]|uniref:hypothetical protein n=1 Tax=Plantibacter auratus TaxID=272914 RepID=UPI003D329E4E
MSEHNIWFPLFDHPVTVTLSREQLQCVQDALLGKPECVPGWNAHFAGQIEAVLKASIEGATDD